MRPAPKTRNSISKTIDIQRSILLTEYIEISSIFYHVSAPTYKEDVWCYGTINLGSMARPQAMQVSTWRPR